MIENTPHFALQLFIYLKFKFKQAACILVCYPLTVLGGGFREGFTGKHCPSCSKDDPQLTLTLAWAEAKTCLVTMVSLRL